MAKAAKAKKARPDRASNMAAIEAHTRALNRHSKALEKLLTSNAVGTLVVHRQYSKDQIKQTLCDITGNPTLDDGETFSKLLAGDGGVGYNITDQINYAFGRPSLGLIYDNIANMKIGALVDLIFKRL